MNQSESMTTYLFVVVMLTAFAVLTMLAMTYALMGWWALML